MSSDSSQAGPSGATSRNRTSGSSANQEKERETKEAKLNPKMSKALSTSTKRL